MMSQGMGRGAKYRLAHDDHSISFGTRVGSYALDFGVNAQICLTLVIGLALI